MKKMRELFSRICMSLRRSIDALSQLRKRFVANCKRFAIRLNADCKRIAKRYSKLVLRDKLIVCGAGVAVLVLIIFACIKLGGALSTDKPSTNKDIYSGFTPVPVVVPTDLPETNTDDPSSIFEPEIIEPESTRDPILKQSISNTYVSVLQNRLMELGFLDIDEPTSYFGSATAYAVQLFQRQHSLSMDGIAGRVTLSQLFSDNAQKYVLREGDAGLDVKNIQAKLKELGYYSSVLDGHYGKSTISAVKAFQSRNALAPDGLAGEHTIDKLFSPNAIAAAHIVHSETRRANINKMVSTARAQLGKPYVLGATGPNSFDCSGLVYYCLRQAGSSRGRYNAAGYSSVSEWERISSIYNLQIGDLMFFYNNSYTRISHVGIYVGGGYMIDASANNGKVVYRPCRTNYWVTHWAWGRRPW